MNNSELNVCSSCGTTNYNNSKFCMKCGNQLYIGSNENLNAQIQVQQNNVQQVSQNNMNLSNFKADGIKYLNYLLGIFYKPFKTFKNEENDFEDTKSTTIFSLIIVAVLTLVKLLVTMFEAVRVESFSWTGSSETKWVWENLKEVKYLEVLGKTFITYAGIIVAIAVVYYLATLVIKKEIKFTKLLAASATAVVPMLVSSTLLATILSMISIKLSNYIVVIGFIYSLMIIVELVNDQLNLEDKNTKIHFHLICLSILIIGITYVYFKIAIGEAISGLDSYGSLLG